MIRRGGAPIGASPRVLSRTPRLTLAELRDEARARGFSHILTAAGPISLAAWEPSTSAAFSWFRIVGEGMVQSSGPLGGGWLWPLMRPEVKP